MSTAALVLKYHTLTFMAMKYQKGSAKPSSPYTSLAGQMHAHLLVYKSQQFFEVLKVHCPPMHRD